MNAVGVWPRGCRSKYGRTTFQEFNAAVRIGELLLKEKRITAEQLQEALNYQRQNGGKLGLNLIKMGFVKDEEMTALLSRQYGVPSIALAEFEIDPTVVKLVPADTAQKYQIVPLSRAGATLTIAMTDPTNVFAMDDIKFMTGYNVEPVVASETAVLEAIQKYYGKVLGAGAGGTSALEVATKALEDMPVLSDDQVELIEELEEISAETLAKQGEEAPVIKLVNVILMSAIQKGASDIHIEPYEKDVRVRYRIDGILYNVMQPPMKLRDAMTSRIKIMAKLDIAEKRLPQDGRIKIRYQDGGKMKEIDFRVSVSADALRREDRDAPARQGQADARHDEAGLRVRVTEQVRAGDPEAVGHGAGDRSDRIRQDQHAVLVDLPDQYAGNEHHDGRRPGRIQPVRCQPGPGAREASGSISPRRSGASSGRTRTSSWSAKSETSRPRRSRSRRRSPDTSCCRPCTPTTRPAR